MSPFDEAAADAAIDRVASEQELLGQLLTGLEEHPGFRLLAAGVPRGRTKEWWLATRRDMARLRDLYRAHEQVLTAARSARARRMRHIRRSGRDAETLRRLISGAAVATVEDGRSMTAPELVAEFRDVERGVRQVLDVVERVWAELSPGLEACADLLDQAERAVAELNLGDEHDKEAERRVLRIRLDELRQAAVSDPLASLRNNTVETAADTAGTDIDVDRTGVTRLLADCRRVHAELAELVQLRRDARSRMDRLDEALGECERLARLAVLARAEVAMKIAGPLPPEPRSDASARLRAELAAARELYQSACWRELAARLSTVADRVDEEVRRAQEKLGELRAPLRTREELRGRLDLYRVKAESEGRREDLALHREYLAARDLLRRAPCDLAAAARAVERYQRSVEAGSAAGKAAGNEVNGEASENARQAGADGGSSA